MIDAEVVKRAAERGYVLVDEDAGTFSRGGEVFRWIGNLGFFEKIEGRDATQAEAASTTAETPFKKLDADTPFTKEEMEKAVEGTRLAEQKKKFTVKSVTDMSELVGIPSPFIMILNEKPYVGKPGLYWKAERKGYRAIQALFLERDRDRDDYLVEARLYTHLRPEDYTLLGQILTTGDRELFKEIFKQLTRPIIVQRRTNKGNVKMTQIHPHLEALAQTRAIDEALRLFTGCGFAVDETDNEDFSRPPKVIEVSRVDDRVKHNREEAEHESGDAKKV